jgi:hypothetical protein
MADMLDDILHLRHTTLKIYDDGYILNQRDQRDGLICHSKDLRIDFAFLQTIKVYCKFNRKSE